MRILIGCEESGTVTKAFRDMGHDAWSCDIIPSSGTLPQYHIQTDIREILDQNWDMLIAFPPCTHLATSGARWFKKKRETGVQQKAVEFFMTLVNCGIQRIAIENPIGIMSTEYRKPDQIIQPWQFGDMAQKSTCLWLHGLPLLKPTNIVSKGDFHTTKGGRRLPKWYNLPPSPERSKIRSKTFQGIADAMASQWGIS